jgi:succinate-acetate transporter protein
LPLCSAGLVQVLAGVADIRYNEQLGGTALTMYGFFWLTVSLAQLVSMSTTFHFGSALFVPINSVYVFFSAVMIYLTAYRSVALSLLHVVITLAFFSTVCMRLNLTSEMLAGTGPSSGRNPRFLSCNRQSLAGLYRQGDCATGASPSPS